MTGDNARTRQDAAQRPSSPGPSPSYPQSPEAVRIDSVASQGHAPTEAELLDLFRDEAAPEPPVELRIGATRAAPDLQARIAAALALHQPSEEWCGSHDSAVCPCVYVWCTECGHLYPCPTVRALTGQETDHA